jgi:hypothetical protein
MIECATCGGDAEEEFPAVMEDDIYRSWWAHLLKRRGKFHVASGAVVNPMCGVCVQIQLNKPTKKDPSKTYYQRIKEMRGGR